MSGHREQETSNEEEQQNNRFSFLVGIVIAMVIVIAFALLFNH